jgi:hypothetical protein
MSAVKECADVAEPLVEASNDIEDQRAVDDSLPEGREIVSHLLQLAAVVRDREEVTSASSGVRVLAPAAARLRWVGRDRRTGGSATWMEVGCT